MTFVSNVGVSYTVKTLKAGLLARPSNKHLQGTPTAAPLSDGSMRK